VFQGTGESSKTTFLKQMQSLYSYKDLMDDGLGWRNIIYDNLRSAFRMLLSVYVEDDEGSVKFVTDVLVSDDFADNSNQKRYILTTQADGDVNAKNLRFRATRLSSSQFRGGP
jgi:hypothetical protein